MLSSESAVGEIVKECVEFEASSQTWRSLFLGAPDFLHSSLTAFDDAHAELRRALAQPDGPPKLDLLRHAVFEIDQFFQVFTPQLRLLIRDAVLGMIV